MFHRVSIGVRTSTWMIFGRHVNNCCWSFCRNCTLAEKSARGTHSAHFSPCDPHMWQTHFYMVSRMHCTFERQGAHGRVCTCRWISESQQGVWNSVSGFSPAWKSWIVSMEPWIKTVAAETAMKQASRITSKDLAVSIILFLKWGSLKTMGFNTKIV